MVELGIFFAGFGAFVFFLASSKVALDRSEINKGYFKLQQSGRS